MAQKRGNLECTGCILQALFIRAGMLKSKALFVLGWDLPESKGCMRSPHFAVLFRKGGLQEEFDLPMTKPI